MNDTMEPAMFSTPIAPVRRARLGATLFALVLAPALGCGLVQVNGKPVSVPSSGDGDKTASGGGDEASAGGESGGGGGGASGAPAGDSGTDDEYRQTKTESDYEAKGKRAVASLSALEQAFGKPTDLGSDLGQLVFADIVGAKLGHAARWELVQSCFQYADKKDATFVARWAVCGEDAKAVKFDKVIAERKAGGLDIDLGTAEKERLATVIAMGTEVEQDAKDDKGVQQVLAIGQAARTEWAEFASKNADLIATARGLEDGVRLGHAKHFTGCEAKTRPAFEKLARATTFADSDRDPLPFYAGQLRSTLAGEFTALAWGACAYGLDQTAEGLYGAVASGAGHNLARGPRTLTLKRLLAPAFKPKFADRALSWDQIRFSLGRYDYTAPVNIAAMIATQQIAQIAKVEPKGDVTLLSFKRDKIEACLSWVDSDKIDRIDDSGKVVYQRQCARRGMVENSMEPLEVSTMFAAGLKPGQAVNILWKFPLVSWTGKKWHAIMGVALH